MKEYLKEIKKGNTQKYIQVINQYLNEVYGVVINKYDSDKAIVITKDIIMSLYVDILKKYMWQNAEKFIAKSFDKSFKKYSLSIESEVTDIVAPPQVYREIMMELSRSIKRRGFIGNTLKITTFIAVLVLLCAIITAITIEMSKPKTGQTLFRGHSKPLLINEDRHFQEYFTFSRSSHNSSLINLNNTGVALDIVKEKDRIIKIYDEGELLNEFKVDFNSQLLAGNIGENYLVFKQDNFIIKSDFEGIESSRIELNEGFQKFSQYNNYLVITSMKNAKVIDLVSFNILSEQSDDVIGISSNGEIYSSSNYAYNKNLKQSSIVKDKLLNDGSMVVLYSDGTVVRYNESKLLWENSLSSDKDLKIDNLNNGYILETTDKVHIVLYHEGNSYFQSFNNAGKRLLNLKDTQKKYNNNINSFIPPESSYNSDYILVFNQINRFDNNIYVIDTKSVPMREMEIKNNSYSKLLLEKGEDSSYLYANSSNEIEIYEIKNK